jgi:hypothetical protein
MLWKLTSMPSFLILYLQHHSKMADIQTSEVDEKFAPVNVGP